MNGLDDPFAAGLQRGAPDHPIAGHQRWQGTADVAALLSAIGGLNVGMFAETADDNPVLGVTEQAVVHLCAIVRLLQTTLVIGMHPSLLAVR
ncbi:hypothetical protein MA13_contig00004-0215 [Edwardsiella piscicida]|nr:hypothetical protein MA13_contig00004-0215 [Edwardsiella piscicida]